MNTPPADPDPNWRALVTNGERYENVQKIVRSGQPESLRMTAIAIEQDALDESESYAEYELHIRNFTRIPGHSEPQSDSEMPDHGEDGNGPRGTDFGPYKNCTYIDEGTSAHVYRSEIFAIKVSKSIADVPPHSVTREGKILRILNDRCDRCITLVTTFRHEERQVLVMPYMPLSLQAVLERDKGPANAANHLTRGRLLRLFNDILEALAHTHSFGIIHRDVKPSSVLLKSIDGPAYLSDFGTAWHPELSPPNEPPNGKTADVGTGPYRAPEVLLTNRAYGPPVDMWAVGAMLAECARSPPHPPLFKSRPAYEDGSQLGLIADIFKKLGTPTLETWPEAMRFETPPFEMYTSFECKTWDELLPDVDSDIRATVARTVRYQSTERWTAGEARAEIQRLRVVTNGTSPS